MRHVGFASLAGELGVNTYFCSLIVNENIFKAATNNVIKIVFYFYKFKEEKNIIKVTKWDIASKYFENFCPLFYLLSFEIK